MKKNLLPPVSDDVELWIGLLADNELAPDQRRSLVNHLDSHPDHWRRCAIAMMDQQFLLGNSVFATVTSKPVSMVDSAIPKPADTRRQKSLPMLVGAIAAAILVFVAGFAINGVLSKQRHVKQLVQSELTSRATIDMLTDLYCSTIGQSGSPTQLQDVFVDRPTLIELESNEFESVWLTDRQVPQSFLEMLVGSGKSVEIKPYAPRLLTSAMRSFPRPMIAIEVKNTSSIHLLAHGEVQ